MSCTPYCTYTVRPAAPHHDCSYLHLPLGHVVFYMHAWLHAFRCHQNTMPQQQGCPATTSIAALTAPSRPREMSAPQLAAAPAVPCSVKSYCAVARAIRVC